MAWTMAARMAAMTPAKRMAGTLARIGGGGLLVEDVAAAAVAAAAAAATAAAVAAYCRGCSFLL